MRREGFALAMGRHPADRSGHSSLPYAAPPLPPLNSRRGNLQERAERLFAVRGLAAEEVPAKLRGPGFPGPKLR